MQITPTMMRCLVVDGYGVTIPSGKIAVVDLTTGLLRAVNPDMMCTPRTYKAVGNV